MDQKEDQNNAFPPEYAHLEEKAKATQERVDQIDKQIKNLPENSKPGLILHPPGYSKPRYFDRELAMASLEQQKSDLKETTFKQVETEVREADPKIARLVRDETREILFPNPVKQMDLTEQNKYRDLEKDIEGSQNLMDTFFSKSGTVAAKASPEKEQDQSTKESTSISKKIDSMSLRFSQGLSYTKAREKTDIGKGKTRDLDKDKD